MRSGVNLADRCRPDFLRTLPGHATGEHHLLQEAGERGGMAGMKVLPVPCLDDNYAYL